MKIDNIKKVLIPGAGTMGQQKGLRTVWTITDYRAGKTGDPQARTNADFLKQYVDKGQSGFKTNQGFYSYPNPGYTDQKFLSR